ALKRKGRLVSVDARSNGNGVMDAGGAEARIDSSWALQILSGEMSPLMALEQRLGRPGPQTLENVCSLVGERKLWRIDTRASSPRYLPGGGASSFQMSYASFQPLPTRL